MQCGLSRYQTFKLYQRAAVQFIDNVKNKMLSHLQQIVSIFLQLSRQMESILVLL